MSQTKKKNKKLKISTNKKILLIVLSIILFILIILVGYKICTKYLFDKNDTEVTKIPEKQSIELENYDYYLHGNATDYEKTLAEELKKILSSEEVNEEEYAKILTKMFISDLFTLSNKNSSSDITSSQYVYDKYKETFELKIKDTIYASIEVDLDGTRTQKLPTVTNVEITKVKNDKFTYKDKILDNNAYYVTANIEYEKDLDYPTTYKLVLVKNDDLLQVVKAN